MKHLLYRYHIELKELMLVVNDMQTMGKGVHDTCDYTRAETCHAQIDTVGLSTIRHNATNYSIFHGLIVMWTLVLCPKLVLFLIHAKACLEVTIKIVESEFSKFVQKNYNLKN
jgi:hypothetical protein